jgi:hypothetical protein
MSLFDDNTDESYYYDAETEFQEQVLQHADRDDEHPLAYLAIQTSKAVDAMNEFVEQDPHISQSERIAITSDIQEAEQAMSRACRVIPQEVTDE